MTSPSPQKTRGRSRNRRHPLFSPQLVATARRRRFHNGGNDENRRVGFAAAAGGDGGGGNAQNSSSRDVATTGKRRRSATPHPNYRLQHGHRHRRHHQQQHGNGHDDSDEQNTTELSRDGHDQRHDSKTGGYHHSKDSNDGKEEKDVLMEEEEADEMEDTGTFDETTDENTVSAKNYLRKFGLDEDEEGDDDIKSMNEADEDIEDEEKEKTKEKLHGDKSHHESMVVTTNRKHVKKWDKFVSKIQKGCDEPSPNLDAYLDAKKKRHNAMKKLTLVVDAAVNEMKAVTTELTDETIVTIHGSKQAEIEAMEKSVSTSFYKNDERRKGLKNTMDVANRKWYKMYENMAGRIMNTIREHESQENIVNSSNRSDKSQKREEASKEGGTMFDPQQIDWNTLTEYEPSRGNIEAFLETLDKRRDATRDLEDIYHNIKSDLGKFVDDIFSAVAETHLNVQDGVDDKEEDLESLMMNNHKGRCDMLKLLRESEKRARERFNNLRTNLAL